MLGSVVSPALIRFVFLFVVACAFVRVILLDGLLFRFIFIFCISCLFTSYLTICFFIFSFLVVASFRRDRSTGLPNGRPLPQRRRSAHVDFVNGVEIGGGGPRLPSSPRAGVGLEQLGGAGR